MRKLIVAVLLVYIGMISAPWIWLENTYGIHNIPHYDLTMWIFMMLYGLIGLFMFGLFLILNATRDEEPEPRKRIRKPRKPEKTEEPGTEEEAPEELQVEAPELGELLEKQHNDKTVEHPAEWDEEDFE